MQNFLGFPDSFLIWIGVKHFGKNATYVLLCVSVGSHQGAPDGTFVSPSTDVAKFYHYFVSLVSTGLSYKVTFSSL